VIVGDASVVVELLLGPGSPAGSVLARHFGDQEVVCAPHLLDAEVGQALRRFVQRRNMSLARAQASLDDLADLPLRRFPHTALLSRALVLRANVTMYDGIYLALAEALGAPLISCDAALRSVPGCRATVKFVPASLSRN